MDELRQIIYRELSAEHPMSVRQVFYRLTVLGAIGKTEHEYKSTVVRLLTLMRREGQIPFAWIADSTRMMRKPRTFSSLEQALNRTADTYRHSLWDNQDAYVEIWLEKDALAGVLFPVTERWDVPLMVTRGYPSLSFLHGAAEVIAANQKPAYLYYFGDRDPSGLDITRAVEAGIREFAVGAEIHFERVAVTEDQVRDWRLPTRPTKTTDSRSAQFSGESVEVDAIPSAELRSLTEGCITRHIEPRALERLRVIERAERTSLYQIIQGGADVWERVEARLTGVL